LREATPELKTRFAIGFVVTQAELDRASSIVANVIEGGAVVWMAYSKGSSKTYTCDFNRDSGWTEFCEAGFEPVCQVAIDDDWTALRFAAAAVAVLIQQIVDGLEC